MTDADKIMHPQQFGIDPTDIQIRIRINPKIRIQIADHFLFQISALAEVCTLGVLLLVLSGLIRIERKNG